MAPSGLQYARSYRRLAHLDVRTFGRNHHKFSVLLEFKEWSEHLDCRVFNSTAHSSRDYRGIPHCVSSSVDAILELPIPGVGGSMALARSWKYMDLASPFIRPD